MTEKVKWQKQAEKWMEKAQRNFSDAQILYREGGFGDTICFLCQQTVEKSLKGLLVYQGQDIKDEFKIHDLVKLADYCKKHLPNIVRLKQEIVMLNRYYIETRYPVEIPQEYSKVEIQKALNIAEKVLHSVENFLS
ncbi:MAG: HEPN protein [uncultured bacterium]|nr:MAG: HEPN protein [uncultured bacterium]